LHALGHGCGFALWVDKPDVVLVEWSFVAGLESKLEIVDAHVVYRALTVITGAIHWKVNKLSHPAVASLDTRLSVGMGGIAPHFIGLGVLYHGFFSGTVVAVVVAEAPLAEVAYGASGSPIGFASTALFVFSNPALLSRLSAFSKSVSLSSRSVFSSLSRELLSRPLVAATGSSRFVLFTTAAGSSAAFVARGTAGSDILWRAVAVEGDRH
jgi:hypothetical protein